MDQATRRLSTRANATSRFCLAAGMGASSWPSNGVTSNQELLIAAAELVVTCSRHRPLGHPGRASRQYSLTAGLTDGEVEQARAAGRRVVSGHGELAVASGHNEQTHERESHPRQDAPRGQLISHS